MGIRFTEVQFDSKNIKNLFSISQLQFVWNENRIFPILLNLYAKLTVVFKLSSLSNGKYAIAFHCSSSCARLTWNVMNTCQKCYYVMTARFAWTFLRALNENQKLCTLYVFDWKHLLTKWFTARLIHITKGKWCARSEIINMTRSDWHPVEYFGSWMNRYAIHLVKMYSVLAWVGTLQMVLKMSEESVHKTQKIVYKILLVFHYMLPYKESPKILQIVSNRRWQLVFVSLWKS